jgi:hypothetical protein
MMSNVDPRVLEQMLRPTVYAPSGRMPAVAEPIGPDALQAQEKSPMPNRALATSLKVDQKTSL